VRRDAAVVRVGDDALDAKRGARPDFISGFGPRPISRRHQDQEQTLQILRVIAGDPIWKPGATNRELVVDVMAPVLDDDLGLTTLEPREDPVAYRRTRELVLLWEQLVSGGPLLGAAQLVVHLRRCWRLSVCASLGGQQE